MKQQSEEWFQARRNRVTGSVAGAALGLSPWLKKNDLLKQMVLDRIGQPQEFKTNPALEYGKSNEANAMECFKLETGLNVEECGFFPHEEWLGASPDGLTSDNGVLEIKCPFGLRNDTEPKFKAAEEQPQYYAQMQIEMLCAQKTHCHFYQWNAYAQKHDIVNFDPLWVEENLPLLREFWETVQSEPEWKYTHGGPQAREYELALQSFNDAKEKLETSKAELINIAGPGGGHIGDFKITRVKPKSKIDYLKAVKENLPDYELNAEKIIKSELPDLDIEPYRKTPIEYWKVT